MKTLFSRPLAYGLVALGLLAGTAVPLQAGPLPSPQLQAPVTANMMTPVRDAQDDIAPNSEWILRNRNRRGDNGWRQNRQWHGDNNWRQNRQWNENDNWRRNRHWRGDNNRRYRRHYRDDYLGFGLGLGLGVVPTYRYVEPQPVYRGLSPAHVRWCSARYRTYRAWDNTYVPRVGYRAICRSPFG